MTQNQIHARRKVIEKKILELFMAEQCLNKELGDLRKQCAHSSRTEFQHRGWMKSERCNDCGEFFFYQ